MTSNTGGAPVARRPAERPAEGARRIRRAEGPHRGRGARSSVWKQRATPGPAARPRRPAPAVTAAPDQVTAAPAITRGPAPPRAARRKPACFESPEPSDSRIADSTSASQLRASAGAQGHPNPRQQNRKSSEVRHDPATEASPLPRTTRDKLNSSHAALHPRRQNPDTNVSPSAPRHAERSLANKPRELRAGGSKAGFARRRLTGRARSAYGSRRDPRGGPAGGAQPLPRSERSERQGRARGRGAAPSAKRALAAPSASERSER